MTVYHQRGGDCGALWRAFPSILEVAESATDPRFSIPPTCHSREYVQALGTATCTRSHVVYRDCDMRLTIFLVYSAFVLQWPFANGGELAATS